LRLMHRLLLPGITLLLMADGACGNKSANCQALFLGGIEKSSLSFGLPSFALNFLSDS